MADLIGLAALAVLTFILRLLVGAQDISNFFWCIIYFLLVMAGLFVWHQRSFSPQPESSWPESSGDYLNFALASVGIGAISFAADILIGSMNHPDLSLIQAGTHAGGPFGFIITLFICPAMTFVMLAGALRQFYVERKEKSPSATTSI
jgi:hypothetical protein